MTIALYKTIPILRIFSVEKAKEFYVDYLGCTVDWGYHFEENTPSGTLRGWVGVHKEECGGYSTGRDRTGRKRSGALAAA